MAEEKTETVSFSSISMDRLDIITLTFNEQCSSKDIVAYQCITTYSRSTTLDRLTITPNRHYHHHIYNYLELNFFLLLQWSNHAENFLEQRDQILEYLNKYLKPHLPENIMVFDVSGSKDFLNNNPLLPFNARGGTDIILVEESAVFGKFPIVGVHAVIEMKQRSRVTSKIKDAIYSVYGASLLDRPILIHLQKLFLIGKHQIKLSAPLNCFIEE
ncbi:21273_t:CDS:1 [Dentiscutata erythropus]|uniref:21273_t:CDS:1 n=1 Tax=Dentiscutata erythropus TaxID=1348616 RepID=A0A9N9P7F4_9GLOM|nr:21273_t:CDS:1 [Dentiscutata erythropus]